jgi:hypothetical protein
MLRVVKGLDPELLLGIFAVCFVFDLPFDRQKTVYWRSVVNQFLFNYAVSVCLGSGESIPV